MASVIWDVSKDSRIAYRTSDGWQSGAGASQFSPTGLYSGYRYRTLLGFSYSFSGMTSISAATLYVRSSTQNYVAFGGSPAIYISRLLGSFSEGTASALSATNAVTYANQPSFTDTNISGGSVTTSELTWQSFDITGIIQNAFTDGVFYGLLLRAQNESTGTQVWEICTREYSTSSDAYIEVTYATNTAPNAPVSLSPTGSAVVNTLTPTFTGTFSDPDAGDTLSNYQILVYADDGTTLKWDSGSLGGSGTSFSKVYSGSALTGNTFYKWQARTADASAVWGSYSAQQRFKVNSSPNAPSISLTESPTSDILTLTPTFNMTHNDPDPSDSSMYGYHITVQTSAGAAVWDSGDVAVSATVSKAVTYSGPALSWGTAYKWKARTKDSNGAWGSYTSYTNFTTHGTGVPISLDPTGSVIASSLTPTFVGSRASSSDSLTSAAIQVYASDGTTLIWDSGTFTSGVTSTGFSKIYAGTALSSATAYKWRARVTGSIGGTSSYSSLQSFSTPDTTLPVAVTPVGSAVTPVTNLQFTFTRSVNFNRHELYVYQSDGTTLVTSDTPVAYTATGSKTFTYSGTLSWNTTYKWKVRVSADGGTNWTAFTGLVTFTTDASGIGSVDRPSASSWLGTPQVIDEFDDITSVTNGTSSSSSLDTAVFQTGLGSLKMAISGLAASATSHTYRAVTKNLANYGDGTPIYIYVRYSSSTNVSTLRLRITFATASDYVEYNIIPSTTNAWEQKTLTKGSPTATSGTVDWTNITRIGVVLVAAGGGSVTSNVYVDDLKFDAINPVFEGTTFNSEVISTFQIRLYASDQTTLIWDSGAIAGSGTTFTKLYDSTALTKGSTYYWQWRYTRSTGPTGDYTSLIPFTLNSEPTVPTALTPASGDVIETTTPHFFSTFNDAEKTTLGDAPTYLEVEVYRNSDSVLAYSLLTKTGLIAGTNEIYDGLSGVTKTTGAAAPIVAETEYKYRVRYYDSMGARGAWTSYTNFKPSVAPTATISSPADSGTVGSPSFTISWSMSSPAGKGQNSYRVEIIRVSDSVTMLDTGRIYSSATSYVTPAGYLQNFLQYDVRVTLYDTDSLYGTDTNRITASWTAPDAIDDFTVTDDESLSASILNWTASNLAAVDFRKYVIYRKITSAINWTMLDEITNQATVSYYDYTAANTVSYQYKITQMKIVPGDVDLESPDSSIGTAILDTDSWFVIGADRAAEHIFEIPVIGAPFVEPVQQEVFEPLGTSRKVIVRGRVMGAEGTIQAKWPNSQRVTAVQQVDYIKSSAGPHILKSPFGDVWQVQFSGPSKDYEQGGHLTISLSWTEVL